MMPLPPKLLAVALALISAAGAVAQTPAPELKTADRNGTIVLSPRQAVDNGVRPGANFTLAPEVRERIERLERIRDGYLREQERLRRLLNGASTDEERTRIRDLIAKTREQFLDNLNRFREDLKDRLPELRRRLPEMNEVLDNARDRARDAANQVRKRRGTD